MMSLNRPMGLILDMPAEQYHAVDALSATGLRQLARSPWHYRNRVEVVPTKAMLCGTLAHCAALEPHALASRYAFVPPGAPKRPTEAQWNAKKSNEDSMAAKAWWTAFGEDVAGRTIVSPEDYAITQKQLEALNSDLLIADLLAKGYGEASVFWIDPATGIYCKARPDWVHPLDDKRVKLLDLKSTADESPNGFGRAAASMGYHRQAAHYTEGFERATGMKVEEFAFAAVTSKPPVLAVPYLLTDEIAEQGRDECRELYEIFANCQEMNRWPSYGDGYQLLDFPVYAKRSNEIEIYDVE